MLGAGIQRLAGQPVQHGDEAVGCIVGKMRVADMALLASGLQRHRQGAPPADLRHVAQCLDAGRLADDAPVENVALGRRPAQQLDRAVDRRALLVAGDEHADRALRPSMALEKARGRGGEAGDLALHVEGTSAEEPAVADHRAERVVRPGVQVARWHDVGMAGKGQMGCRIAEPGEQIVDSGLAAGGEPQPLDGKAERRQCFGQHTLRPRIGRRDARTAHQRPGQLDRVGRRHQSRSSSLIDVLARVLASTRLTMTAQ